MSIAYPGSSTSFTSPAPQIVDVSVSEHRRMLSEALRVLKSATEAGDTQAATGAAGIASAELPGSALPPDYAANISRTILNPQPLSIKADYDYVRALNDPMSVIGPSSGFQQPGQSAYSKAAEYPAPPAYPTNAAPFSGAAGAGTAQTSGPVAQTSNGMYSLSQPSPQNVMPQSLAGTSTPTAAF